MIEIQGCSAPPSLADMNKLGTLVAEGRVVPSASMTKNDVPAGPRRNTEVDRHAADQKSLATGPHPRESTPASMKSSSCRASCNRQHPAPAENMVGQPLRARDIGQAAIENFLKQRVAARHRTADDNRSGCSDLTHRHSPRSTRSRSPQLRAHRRIDASIAAGHAMPDGTRQLGNASL